MVKPRLSCCLAEKSRHPGFAERAAVDTAEKEPHVPLAVVSVHAVRFRWELLSVRSKLVNQERWQWQRALRLLGLCGLEPKVPTVLLERMANTQCAFEEIHVLNGEPNSSPARKPM
jgi:hypothetical protein